MASLADLVVAIAAGLIAHRDELNRLDAVAGDGDLGLTASAAATALTELVAMPEVAALPEGEAIRRMGRTIASKAPSTGGTLIAFGLMAAGRAEVDAGAPGQARAAAYLRAAADTIAARGNVKPGDRTMLDALLPAVEALDAAARSDSTPADAARAAAAAADGGARATTAMAATVGRAAWLAERARDHEDAGARLVAAAFAAAAAALD